MGRVATCRSAAVPGGRRLSPANCRQPQQALHSIAERTLTGTPKRDHALAKGGASVSRIHTRNLWRILNALEAHCDKRGALNFLRIEVVRHGTFRLHTSYLPKILSAVGYSGKSALEVYNPIYLAADCLAWGLGLKNLLPPVSGYNNMTEGWRARPKHSTIQPTADLLRLLRELYKRDCSTSQPWDETDRAAVLDALLEAGWRVTPELWQTAIDPKTPIDWGWSCFQGLRKYVWRS